MLVEITIEKPAVVLLCIAIMMTCTDSVTIPSDSSVDDGKTVMTSWELKSDQLTASTFRPYEQLIRALKACGMKNAESSRSRTTLSKMMLSSYLNVTCNDGSPAG